MNNEDYVSYELALKLKKCGFDEPCDHYYNIEFKNDTNIHYSINRNYNNIGKRCCSAPLLYQAHKWLREVKNIIVDVSPDWDPEDYCLEGYLTGEWYFTVWKDGDRVYCNFDPNAVEERIWMFEKYEQALSAGIDSALELIEQENK